MKISLICIGKTDESYIVEGITKYQNRLKHYIAFTLSVIPDIKNSKHLSIEKQRSMEAGLLLKKLHPGDQLYLLDERGKEFRSIEFATFLEKKMLASTQHLVFAIGGPYGFHQEVYNRASGKISLSRMTFSHQMTRLFFVEQLYRAFSILKQEPYHHE